MHRASIVLVSLTLAVQPGPATTETAASTANQPAAVRAQPTAAVPAQARIIYRDPETGRLQPPPPGAWEELLAEAETALRTDSEGLVERDSPVPGGGKLVDLQGRFRPLYVATRTEDGQVATGCLEDAVSEPDLPAHPSEASGLKDPPDSSEQRGDGDAH